MRVRVRVGLGLGLELGLGLGLGSVLGLARLVEAGLALGVALPVLLRGGDRLGRLG